MAKKRNRITLEMTKTITETSPLIKSSRKISKDTETENFIKNLEVKKLVNNPFQPRIEINTKSLNELISSIEENGLLQPIIVTPNNLDDNFTIIAGHRRYEAFKILGKAIIPAIIKKDASDKDLAILSLTENLMRENLHPIENAIAIKNILDNNIVESQNKLAQYVGLSKGYVSKLLNILKLPTSVIKIIKNDNYKDINILVLLNKFEDTNKIFEVYKCIKKLPRKEAELHIKNLLLSNEKRNKSLVSLKTTKTNILLNINIKNLDKKNISFINEKITNLNNEILIFLEE